MEKKEFYDRCNEILGAQHEFREIWKNNRRSGRWGPREPGNGRFPGFGLIRWFGSTVIHVSLSHPISVNRTFSSPSAVFEFLAMLEK